MALQWMRDRFKHLKWVLWVVIAAFVIFFGSDFSSMGNADTNRVAAWVGDEEISADAVRSQYRNLEAYWRQAFGERYNADMARQMNLAGQALQQVLQQRIMLREARELGLMVTDKEVREEILNMPGLQNEDGAFVGAEEYKRRVRRSGRMTPDAFEKQVREGVLLGKLETILAETVYVSDSELEERYREQAEKATIRYLLLPNSQFTEIELSDEDLQAHLDAHLEIFQLSEQRIVDYVLVDAIKIRQELEIPEAELRAYYDEHIAEYTTEEQILARHILLQTGPDRDAEATEQAVRDLRARVEAGEDFAALARDTSEEPDSAGRGGSLGWFGRNAWGADFTEIVFGADRGALVGPVTTQYGVHLIEVQDHRAGGARPFEQVTAQIRNRLVAERANELAESRGKDLAERLIEETMDTDAFAAFAASEDLTLTTTEPFGQRDIVPGIGRGLFVETAFGLKRNGVSEPVKLPRGWAILRLGDVLAPRAPTLEEVVGRVRPAALAERQREAAKSTLDEAMARLGAGTLTFDALAEELSLEALEGTSFGIGEPISGLGRLPELVDDALAGETGSVGGPYSVPQGAVLFEVKERTHFDPETFASERDTFRETQRGERLNQIRAAIIARRLRDLEVRTNDQVMEILGIDPSRIPT